MAKPNRETGRHGAAFEYYVALGHGRSLALVAKAFSVSEQAVFGWSSAFKWQKRLQEREKIVAEKLAGKAVEDEADMRHRQLTICKAVQGAFVERLKGKSVQITARDFVEAAKLERLVVGKPTERSEVSFGTGVAQLLMTSLADAVERAVPAQVYDAAGVEIPVRERLAQAFQDAALQIGAT